MCAVTWTLTMFDQSPKNPAHVPLKTTDGESYQATNALHRFHCLSVVSYLFCQWAKFKFLLLPYHAMRLTWGTL